MKKQKVSTYTQEEVLTMVFRRNREFFNAVNRLIKWDRSLELEENARRLGISYQSAANLKYGYQLECKRKRRAPESHLRNTKISREDARALVTQLRGKGFTLQRIGTLLNMTRERVRQIQAEKSTGGSANGLG